MAESTRDESGNVTQIRYVDHAGNTAQVNAPNPQNGRVRIGVTPSKSENGFSADLEKAEARRFARDILDLASGDE